LAGRARVALEQRLQANRYLSAAHESFGRYLAAKDAKDTKAMQLQLQALVDYSSVGLETARTAAVRRFEYEQRLLAVLEASLAATAGGGGAAGPGARGAAPVRATGAAAAEGEKRDAGVVIC